MKCSRLDKSRCRVKVVTIYVNGCGRADTMAASAMMMQACLLQQQQASTSAALGFPSYFGLSPLIGSFLVGGFPRSSLLGNSFTPLSTSLSAFPSENESHRLVGFLTVQLVSCCTKWSVSDSSENYVIHPYSVSKKSSLPHLKLFAIFLCRLSIFSQNFAN